jgi:iron complex outermembrane receptor protein
MTHHRALLRIPAAILSFLALGLAAPSTLIAQTTEDDILIEAQALGTALQVLAEEYNLQLLYESALVSNRLAKAVPKGATREGALNGLLADTDLDYRFVNERTVAVASQETETVKEENSGKAQPAPEMMLLAQAESAGDIEKKAREIEAEQAKEYAATLEEIVVTATKHGETKLQETGMAISVFNSEDLERGGILELNDIEKLVPNLTTRELVRDNGVFLRGVGGLPIWTGGHDAVSIYVDDAYTPRHTGMFSSILDIERVEVLRGPQGTLYGRNTSGGAIRLITKKPTEVLTGYATAEFGTENRLGLEGALSGPITDNLKARFAFIQTSRDGFFDNNGPNTAETVDDDERLGARLTVQFTPSERSDFVLTAEYQKKENEGGSPFGFQDTTGLEAIGAQPYNVFEDLATAPVPTGIEHINERVDLTATFKLARDISLKSVTAYSHHRRKHSSQEDGSTLNLLYQSFERQDWTSFTQEFQLNGSWGNLDLVGGFFYLYEDEYVLMTGEWDFGDPSTFQGPGFSIASDDYGMDGDSYAAYLTGNYALTERLSVLAGIRYSHEERARYIDNQFVFEPGTPAEFFVWDFEDVDKHSWEAVTPKLALEYRATEDALLYASITRGFRAGGWAMSIVGSDQPPFEEEYVWSYEVGAKTDWYDRRLRVNLALFYTDYTDMQLASFGVVPGAGFQIFMRNATDSEISGGELEIWARPVPNLDLGVSIGSVFGEYGSFVQTSLQTGQPEDQKGKTIMFAPEWSINAFANYVVSMNWGSVSFSANYSWHDDYFPEPTNFYVIPGKGILDVGVMFESADRKYYVEAYGRNLTDKRYFNSLSNASGFGGALPSGQPVVTVDNGHTAMVSDGRNVGVRFGYRF